MTRLTPAVLRALDILELFLAEGSQLTAPDVGRMTGLPRTTVHELLATLTARDYLRKDETSGAYKLGPQLLQLGNAYSARFDMLGAANQVARQVSESCNETVSVALLEQTNVFYLAKVEARELWPLASSVGNRLPAHCTAIGKVLLSALTDEELARRYGTEDLPVLTDRSIATLSQLTRELADVRRDGVAFEVGESGIGTCCAAVGVRNVRDEIVAALSVSAPEVRWKKRDRDDWVSIARAGAGQLSSLLGWRGPDEEAD